ncbi:hypothetical protein [Robbsia sp. KACC 23696]|uniref:hypothetical protein n=1 Tax=Robbsia sp. KACC 23696 TaxID=3149231 RepID=UPI00325B5173
MDQAEALEIARQATRTALEEAGWNKEKAHAILLRRCVLEPRIDRALNMAGRLMLDAEQAEKH